LSRNFLFGGLNSTCVFTHIWAFNLYINDIATFVID